MIAGLVTRLGLYAVLLGGTYFGIRAYAIPWLESNNPIKAVKDAADDVIDKVTGKEDEVEPLTKAQMALVSEAIEEQNELSASGLAGLNQREDSKYTGGNGFYYHANPNKYWLGSPEGLEGANILAGYWNNRRADSNTGERVVNGLSKKYGPQTSSKAYAGKIEHPLDYFKMMAALLKWGDLDPKDLGAANHASKLNAFVNDFNWQSTQSDRQGFQGIALPIMPRQPYFAHYARTKWTETRKNAERLKWRNSFD